jgi:hypothetical protein
MNSSLDSLWMPFTPNRQFKAAPRLVADAQGVACRTPDGREVLDGIPVGGMTNHRRALGGAMLRADHLASNRAPAPQAFVRGQPEHGLLPIFDEFITDTEHPAP